MLEDLDGRIDLVLDGGATQVGVESTVLDLSGDVPTVLRPGAVTLEMLRPLLPLVRVRGGDDSDGEGRSARRACSTRHYSPRAPLTLYEGPRDAALERLAHDAEAARAAGRRVGVLLADDDSLPGSSDPAALGAASDAAAIAARLYAALRELDAAGVDEILARALPAPDGLGAGDWRSPPARGRGPRRPLRLTG